MSKTRNKFSPERPKMYWFSRRMVQRAPRQRGYSEWAAGVIRLGLWAEALR